MNRSDIDQKFLDDVIAYRYPDITETATQMAGGTEPAGATPMTIGEFATSVADVPAGLLKGAVQGTIGLPGDIESLTYGVREIFNRGAGESALDAFLTGLEKKTILPTTENVRAWLDTNVGPLVPAGASERRREAAKIPEFVGELGGAGKTVIEGTRAIGRGVNTGAMAVAEKAVQAITGNPQATALRVLEETSMPFMQAMAPKIVKPGDQVSGLTVRKEVPNMGSISASLDDYEVLSGIREVPRGAFDKEYLDSLSFEKLDERTKDLANQINESKEINPMIVGVDSKGAYIIEGGHRFDALMAQDTKSIPAVVVIDKSDPPTEDVLRGLLEPEAAQKVAKKPTKRMTKRGQAPAQGAK